MGIRHHSDINPGDWMQDPDSFATEPPMIKVEERLSSNRVRVAAANGRTWEVSFGPNDRVHVVSAAAVAKRA